MLCNLCLWLWQSEKERVKASWHSRMAKFNDRSDTPLLYNFVDTLPSWEYYDIHRQAPFTHLGIIHFNRTTVCLLCARLLLFNISVQYWRFQHKRVDLHSYFRLRAEAPCSKDSSPLTGADIVLVLCFSSFNICFTTSPAASRISAASVPWQCICLN